MNSNKSSESPATAVGRSSTRRHRVVVIGSGFGGLFATRALKRADVDVTVVDRTNHHLFQPLLYQLATGILSEGEIAPPTRDILRKQANATVWMGEVTAIDLEARSIAVESFGRTRTLPYDSLIVSAGAGQSYFGHDEFEAFAPSMKTIDDALELRRRIYGAFEVAETTTDPEVRRQWLTFVVIGAGPTGVEIAGQIRELAHRALRRNFRVIDPSQTRVVLVEGGERVLASFGDRLSAIATTQLRRRGIEVRTATMVTGIDAEGVTVMVDSQSPERISARTAVWAAGVQASALGRQLVADGDGLDRQGRVKVRADCTLPGHPEVFVIGDMMALSELPGVAEVAIQSGLHAAATIAGRLKGRSTKDFRYRDLGSLATVSRFRAVASFGRIRIGGVGAWLLWLVVHLVFLTGFKNRLAALWHWGVSFLGRGRIERAIGPSPRTFGD